MMPLINPDRYHTLVNEAQNAAFSGWDFSWLKGRMIQEDPPWDYKNIILNHMKSIHSLLDMGTGGGEFLASINPLPQDTHATEAYPPNLVIALKNLEPLGVKVHNFTKERSLSFNDDYFDLVINRHDSFTPAEVKRLLKPGGRFITQQVGGLNNLELNQILEKTISFEFIDCGLAATLTNLYEEEFVIEVGQKAALRSSFLDIGAVVYYLKAIPWQIKGFAPETHADGLMKLHNIIETLGEFTTTAHRFLIVARKSVPHEK